MRLIVMTQRAVLGDWICDIMLEASRRLGRPRIPAPPTEDSFVAVASTTICGEERIDLDSIEGLDPSIRECLRMQRLFAQAVYLELLRLSGRHPAVIDAADPAT